MILIRGAPFFVILLLCAISAINMVLMSYHKPPKPGDQYVFLHLLVCSNQVETMIQSSPHLKVDGKIARPKFTKEDKLNLRKEYTLKITPEQHTVSFTCKLFYFENVSFLQKEVRFVTPPIEHKEVYLRSGEHAYFLMQLDGAWLDGRLEGYGLQVREVSEHVYQNEFRSPVKRGPMFTNLLIK